MRDGLFERGGLIEDLRYIVTGTCTWCVRRRLRRDYFLRKRFLLVKIGTKLVLFTPGE